MNILVIDDDPAMTELLRLLLQSTAYNVTTSNSGREGVLLCKETSPDIIILDLMMPEMDGWAVCHAVRRFSNIPILILSALDSPAMIARALDAGADDYLVKPVPVGTLIARINALARRSHKPLGSWIVCTT